MSQGLQLMCWAVAALVPFLINLAAHKVRPDRYVDAVGLSLMLLLTCAISNILIVSPPGQPENMLSLSVLDLICLGISVAAWGTRPRSYKLLLAFLFLFQIGLHAAFWMAWPQPHLLYSYKASLNAMFLLQLVTVAWPGGAELVRHGRAHLPLPRWDHHHLRLGPRK